MLYTDRILRDATRRQMWTPVTLNSGGSYPYGFGWELGSLAGRQLVHHGGGMPGFRAEFARFVDDRLTIIVLMNLDEVDLDPFVRGVAATYLPSPVPIGITSRSGRERWAPRTGPAQCPEIRLC